jgi:cell division inhibitor SepF
VVTHAKPRLHIPSSFEDASRIADDFRSGAPVVMNLTKVEKPVARRLVDFASGVCYVLAGGMERVAANVYLLTPAGVDVSAEDRRRMQERGFER